MVGLMGGLSSGHRSPELLKDDSSLRSCPLLPSSALVSARASNQGSRAWDGYSIRGASLNKKKKSSHADPSRVQQGSSVSRFGTLFLVLMSPGSLPVHGGGGREEEFPCVQYVCLRGVRMPQVETCTASSWARSASL